VREDEQEEEASLGLGREVGDWRGEQVDGETKDKHEGESCSTECSGKTGRRLVHCKGNGVAHKACCHLSGNRKLWW
jgi:hypothetical protein